MLASLLSTSQNFTVVHVLLTFLLVPVGLSVANYRHYHIENADVCGDEGFIRGSETVLDVGTGAAIFSLASPSSRFQPHYWNKVKRCRIHIKTPDNSYGLMAFIEEMHMRKDSRDSSCVDYIQFGQDDMVPFLTVFKSDRLCGEISAKSAASGRSDDLKARMQFRAAHQAGAFYDDPYGNLLVWISVGGRRQTSSWPIISVVNLTLVVTAYQKACRQPRAKFLRCGKHKRCISSSYFCDDHFNCPADYPSFPLDERDCNLASADKDSTRSKESGGDSGVSSGTYSGGLNIISLSLIIVCCGVTLMTLMFLVLRYKARWKPPCFRNTLDSVNNRESQSPSGAADRRPRRGHQRRTTGQPRSISELSQSRFRHDMEQNVYQPLTPFATVLGDRVGARDDMMETSLSNRTALRLPVEEEPPPAYQDLFPDNGSNEVASNSNDLEQHQADSQPPVPANSSATRNDSDSRPEASGFSGDQHTQVESDRV